ncbi:MAG: HEAT repeat domain-containing protein [Candidatus Thiodiazotropha sp. (ex Dulcina madagascariensis)]|nr:HEAT repeat domain-containing protein [Candidatus Thiodiazotropha sp. (ex Dulcina madagascariensis)]
MTNPQAPDVLFLLATGCTHCPAVLEGLSRLLKQGRIGRLEAVNVVEQPEAAQRVGAQSVPWTRIGAFEFEGVLTPGELSRWVDLAGRDEGIGAYYQHLLETQRPDKVRAWLKREPDSLPHLIALLKSDQIPMTVRIGIGVVFEELQGSDLLLHALPSLTALTRSSLANVRADAAHYLGLTHSSDASASLRNLLNDENPDVREIAADSLNLIQHKKS